MGLSLYLDQIIMKHLDGGISAKTHFGKGTAVTIVLPLAQTA